MIDLKGDGRVHVTVVDRVFQYRFPKSKKRRIRRKWAKRESNFRPNMNLIGVQFIVGSMARLKEIESSEKPTVDYGDRYLEMSTDLWCYISAMNPDFAERCDLYENVLEEQNGVKMTAKVLIYEPN